jgi:hypothetical protein
LVPERVLFVPHTVLQISPPLDSISLRQNFVTSSSSPQHCSFDFPIATSSVAYYALTFSVGEPTSSLLAFTSNSSAGTEEDFPNPGSANATPPFGLELEDDAAALSGNAPGTSNGVEPELIAVFNSVGLISSNFFKPSGRTYSLVVNVTVGALLSVPDDDDDAAPSNP